MTTDNTVPRTRLLRRHRRDCASVAAVKNGSWGTPWAYFDTTLSFRGDKIGRIKGGGMYQWWVAICNDSACPARIAVLENDLLPKGLA